LLNSSTGSTKVKPNPVRFFKNLNEEISNKFAKDEGVNDMLIKDAREEISI